jgi:hypothetical protein
MRESRKELVVGLIVANAFLLPFVLISVYLYDKPDVFSNCPNEIVAWLMIGITIGINIYFIWEHKSDRRRKIFRVPRYFRVTEDDIPDLGPLFGERWMGAWKCQQCGRKNPAHFLSCEGCGTRRPLGDCNK